MYFSNKYSSHTIYGDALFIVTRMSFPCSFICSQHYMCDFTPGKRDWQYSNTTIVVILHQNNANFSHLNLKICNSKNIINKRFRILSTQTTSGRSLGIFSLTDAKKYKMHPRRVSVHLCKWKIRGCEELSTSVDQRMLITTDGAFEKRDRDNTQKTEACDSVVRGRQEIFLRKMGW